MTVRGRALVVAVLLAATLVGCSHEKAPPKALTASSLDPASTRVAVKKVQVLETIPHSTGSWTEGLVYDGGKLFESTGRTGLSMLFEIDPKTGTPTRSTPLSPDLYGEGIAKVSNDLIQLTWKNGKGLVWDASTFQQTGSHTYGGEGWGLCYDGKRLVMSNGSSALTFRDPKTFEPTGHVVVKLDGKQVPQLNELECVDGKVYANVWQTQRIVVIDPSTGKVTEVIDASGLLHPTEAASADVLNGIAYDPASKTFWLTGKLWPHMFRVKFVPA